MTGHKLWGPFDAPDRVLSVMGIPVTVLNAYRPRADPSSAGFRSTSLQVFSVGYQRSWTLDRVFSCFGRFLFSRPFSRFFGRRRFLFSLFVSWAFTVLGLFGAHFVVCRADRDSGRFFTGGLRRATPPKYFVDPKPGI